MQFGRQTEKVEADHASRLQMERTGMETLMA